MLWLVLILYTLCASSFTIAKAVLSYAAPIFFVGIRMSIAGIVLLGFLYLRGFVWHIKKSDWYLFLPIILFHIYGAYVGDMLSLQYISSFKSAFFFNASPFITALLSYYFFGQRITMRQWTGLIIGFIGLLPMLLKETSAEHMAGQLLFFSIPELLLLGSVVASCIGWLNVQKLLNLGYSPLLINGVGMLYGGLLALGTSFLTEHWFTQGPVSAWMPFLGLTALIILVCNILFYNLYGYLLHFYTATFLSFAGFLCPLITALFGMIFLHEEVTWHFAAAMLIVGSGLYLFYQEELR